MFPNQTAWKESDSLRGIYGARGETITYFFFFLLRTLLFYLLSNDSVFSGNETVTHPSLLTGVLFDYEATEV